MKSRIFSSSFFALLLCGVGLSLAPAWSGLVLRADEKHAHHDHDHDHDHDEDHDHHEDDGHDHGHHDHAHGHDHDHSHGGGVERVTLRWMTKDGAWGLVGSNRSTILTLASNPVKLPLPPASLISAVVLVLVLGLFVLFRLKRRRAVDGASTSDH